jgi:hypothetical protein
MIREAANFVCTFLTGAGIGWFLGLSLDAVASTVITALLTLVTGTATVLAGVGIATRHPDTGEPKADPLLVMFLVLGLVGGSITSGFLRSSLLLGASSRVIAEKTGFTKEYVARVLFDRANGFGTPTTVSSAALTTSLSQGNQLPTMAKQLDCGKLRGLKDQALLAEVTAELGKQTTPDQTLLDSVKKKDADMVRKIVDRVCDNQ